MPSHYSAETVSIEGADAVAFAQAQFSSNLAALETGRWQFSAWLDPQGRVRALFHLARLADERLLLLLRGGEAVALAGALQRYVLRARVRLAAGSALPLGTSEAMPVHAVEAGDGVLRFGCGTHSLVVGAQRDDAWRLPQIRAGWPWLPSAALDTFLPPALSLDALHATALDKGCYPGQEIVARLHYRGGHKRHMQHVVLSRPLPPGSLLRDGVREIVVLDAMPAGDGCEALAVMHDDDAQQLAGGALAIDGVGIVLADARTSPMRA
ncbi:YgfZ/GcvT domain-containing protein [Fulvimonas soli]|uniref:Aminomethyltransferase folate-binding domain-containing protein n=1 Tax=Fulvimonas soli TaxID=155197 RepID=A0A316J0A2_9GAMM|nr:folate-binding protein YgfZ [Fulvimonas soli]PWK92935.1 hypothetical protein C7456_101276 [Fulvimonas soli]TNY26583.1 folate-binding protein YgfZ [Fulvimonas soli]